MKDKNTVSVIRETLPLWHYWFVRPLKHFLGEGISREMGFLLATLYYQGQEVGMSELAKRVRVSKQQMTKMVDKLIDLNLAERVQDEKDRRIVLIRITDEGRKTIERRNQQETDYYEEITASMSEKDRDLFVESLENIRRILKMLPHDIAK